MSKCVNFFYHVKGGQSTGQLLSAHPEIRKISFTGGAFGGSQVMSASAKVYSQLKTLHFGNISFKEYLMCIYEFKKKLEFLYRIFRVSSM